jgi:DNA invertase Pin-like site-specific DNA recombinase
MQLGKVRVAQQLVKAPRKYLTVEHVETASDNQRRELEAVAQGSGWNVVKIYEDAGISGANGRD